MEGHVKAVGIIFIVMGFLAAGLGVLMFLFMAGIGAVSGDRVAALTTGIIGTIIAAVLVILSLPSIITGFGLLKKKNWARFVGVILAALHIFAFPIGTALAIYSLWVLLNDETTRMFTATASMRPAV